MSSFLSVDMPYLSHDWARGILVSDSDVSSSFTGVIIDNTEMATVVSSFHESEICISLQLKPTTDSILFNAFTNVNFHGFTCTDWLSLVHLLLHKKSSEFKISIICSSVPPTILALSDQDSGENSKDYELYDRMLRSIILCIGGWPHSRDVTTSRQGCWNNRLC